MTRPEFLIVVSTPYYDNRDAVCGYDHRVVDCARSEQHARLIAKRIRWTRGDDEITVKVCTRDADGFLTELRPVRIPEVFDDYVPF
jgi:hypothetical protein